MQLHEIRLLNNEKLTHLCSENNDHFQKNRKRSDGRYCYELIQRAIVGMDDDAWEHLYTLYYPRMTAKIRGKIGEETAVTADDLAQDAFIKFQRYVTPDKWAKFPNLATVLSYMDMCAQTTIIDYYRSRERQKRLHDSIVSAQSTAQTSHIQLDNDIEKRLWVLINHQCKHPEDKLLAELSWVMGLPPRKIAKRFPDKFKNTKAVSEQKRNLWQRLQRNSDIRALYEETVEK